MKMSHWLVLGLTFAFCTPTLAGTRNTTVFIRHKVADFATWHKGLKSREAAKLHKSNRVLKQMVFQDVNDPNDVTVLTEFPSLDAAQKFAQSPELKARMEKVGVVGAPTVWFTSKK